MSADLTHVFQAFASDDSSALLSWVQESREEFKNMSYEEKYQTLLRLAVKMGDPGITGDLPTFDKRLQNDVQEGFTSYFNQDEFDEARKQLEIEGHQNPSNEHVILSLRTAYRGAAPAADEPLKLTLLYDQFRTDEWGIAPEDALIYLQLSEKDDETWGNYIDRALVSHFGKPVPPVL